MIPVRSSIVSLLVLCVLFLAAPLSAEKIYIDISSPGFKKLPIAIQTFIGAREVSEIIKADLSFTGLFDCLDDAAHIERPEQSFSAMSWKGLGVEMVFKGIITASSSSSVDMTVRAFDVTDGREVMRKEYSAKRDLLRQLSHMIANDIYKLLTAQQGIFRSRIAFISEKPGLKHLYLMDWDGERMKPMGPRANIMLAPRWSPDNSKLIYSAERGRKWGIYVYDLNTGSEINTHVPLSGVSIAGNFFPDNRRFVYSASRDGNADILIGNIGGISPRRLIATPWIDVSPSVSPDGNSILFVSNRTGAPQLYISDTQGYNARRITFEGNYNTSPAWSPAGDMIVFASMIGGRNQICIIKPDGTGFAQLTKDGNNEDPSFSPDGRFIAFSSTRDGSKGIFIMRANGEGMRRVTPRGFRSASPAWSPF
jgi:TolB protein